MEWDYDSEADVLYISFGAPRPAVGADMGNGVIMRYDEEQDEIVGITILDTGINCDFRSLRLCALASLRSLFNAKAQGRKDAKEIISVVTSVVVIQPTIKKSSICGGAKYIIGVRTSARYRRGSTSHTEKIATTKPPRIATV